MKNKIIVMLTILFLITINGLYAQTTTTKKIYNGGVYGQTFEITEYSDGNRCRLLITMSDNKNKNTQVQTFDSTLPTVYYIWSKWFSSPGEYSKAVEASKNFFDYDLNLVYLADMKDICDIAPCCKSTDYRIKQWNNSKQKYIYIEYECSDLELLFEIARFYNAKGRDYVFEKYIK